MPESNVKTSYTNSSFDSDMEGPAYEYVFLQTSGHCGAEFIQGNQYLVFPEGRYVRGFLQLNTPPFREGRSQSLGEGEAPARGTCAPELAIMRGLLSGQEMIQELKSLVGRGSGGTGLQAFPSADRTANTRSRGVDQPQPIPPDGNDPEARESAISVAGGTCGQASARLLRYRQPCPHQRPCRLRSPLNRRSPLRRRPRRSQPQPHFRERQYLPQRLQQTLRKLVLPDGSFPPSRAPRRPSSRTRGHPHAATAAWRQVGSG